MSAGFKTRPAPAKGVTTIPMYDFGFEDVNLDFDMPVEDKLTFGQPLVTRKDLSAREVASRRAALKERCM